MKNSIKTQPLALALAVSQVLLYQSAPSQAQSLEEVVVTARKRTETLMDAPVAIAAVSGKAMEAQGITNMEQLSAKVPGLQIGRAAQTTNVAIRGVGSGINKGFEQSVGMYVDGIYQPRSRQFTQSMVDVERVEVLRGPQGILFGKNTVAGAIKLETRSAEAGEELNGSLSVAYEPEYDTQRYTATLAGGLSDTLGARLVLRSSSTDGYLENQIFNEDEQQRDDTLARLSVTWEPTDDLRIVGKISRIDMEGEGTEFVVTEADYSLIPQYIASGRTSAVLGSIAMANGLVPFEVSEGGNEYKAWTGNPVWVPGGNEEDTESTNALLNVQWDVGDYTLTSLTGYTEYEFRQFQDVDFNPVNLAHNLDAEELDFFSQEFRVATNWNGRFNVIGGLYYEKQEFYADTFTNLDGTLGGLAVLLTGVESLFGPINDVTRYHFFDQETEAVALFGEVTFDISETLRLELGVRYSEDEKELSKRAEVGTGQPGAPNLLVTPEDTAGSPSHDAYVAAAAAAAGVEGAASATVLAGSLGTYTTQTELDRDEDHFNGSVKLIWNYSDDGMAYVSWSDGYKSGGFNYSPTTALPSGAPTDDAIFEDEEVDAIELGVKHTFWDGRGRGSAIIYRSELDNLQVTAWNGTNFVVGNAAELTVQGLELEGLVAITDSLELGFNYNYLDHEFDSYPGAPCTVVQLAADAGCQNDFSGKRGAFAPEHSAAVNLHHSYDFQNWTLDTRIDVNYNDEMFLDTDLDEKTLQDSYTKIDASVGLSSQDGRWNFVLYGRNLTDETTYTMAADAPLSGGVYASWIEEPRIYGVEATFSF
ncbi:MAG: TonB-dependent receptor [Halieaceae bacterium]|jgi:iron complex outermembrane recepter protein|nr:TonB-dependent receptor [Halieaceae bacterium]